MADGMGLWLLKPSSEKFAVRVDSKKPELPISRFIPLDNSFFGAQCRRHRCRKFLPNQSHFHFGGSFVFSRGVWLSYWAGPY